MAKPIGMPIAHQPKKQANMTQAARLMRAPAPGRSAASQLVLPAPSDQPPQPQQCHDDRARHEQAEAGIENVEADMEDQAPGMAGVENVVDGAGQGGGED